MSSKQRQPKKVSYDLKLIDQISQLQGISFRSKLSERMSFRNKIRELMNKLDKYNLKGIKRDKKY